MATKVAKHLLEGDAKKLISECDAFIFDLDGVVWLYEDILPGARELLNCLRKLGKKVFFVTNNNTKSRQNFMKKFKRLDIEAKESELYTAAFATAFYMKHIAKFDKKVYMIGGEGLSDELNRMGIANIGYGRDDMTDDTESGVYNQNFVLDPEVGAVVSGYDQFISINKFIKASSYLIRDESCLFVATNPDDRMPIPSNKSFFAPGTGCFAAYLERAARRSPVYAGKPSSVMFDCIVTEHKIDPLRTCMIGDTLETDILFGNRCGTKTLLVMSGNANMESVERAVKSGDGSVPDYVAQSVGSLLPFAQQLLTQ